MDIRAVVCYNRFENKHKNHRWKQPTGAVNECKRDNITEFSDKEGRLYEDYMDRTFLLCSGIEGL